MNECMELSNEISEYPIIFTWNGPKFDRHNLKEHLNSFDSSDVDDLTSLENCKKLNAFQDENLERKKKNVKQWKQFVEGYI